MSKLVMVLNLPEKFVAEVTSRLLNLVLFGGFHPHDLRDIISINDLTGSLPYERQQCVDYLAASHSL